MAEEVKTFDPKLAEGIAYFEKMLQVMPGDRTTLEFLCVAYSQTGEEDKRRKALVNLAGVLLKEGDLEAAESIAERLADFSEPDAKAAILRIKAAKPTSDDAATKPAEQAPVADNVPSGAPTTAVRLAIKAENELIRLLAAKKVIEDDVADTALSKLAELAGASGCFLVSALAVLEKENSAAAEAATAYAADTASAPPIPLESFEISSDLQQKLPESITRVRGVLPFAEFGGTLLIATLNPTDDELRQSIESCAGMPCRFYTASPRVMEDLLDKFFAISDQEPEPQKENA